MDISSLFGGEQKTAGYPNTDYPAFAFYGPTSLQPKGGTAEVAHNVTPQQKKHMLVVIIGIAVVGFLVWHLNFVR